METLRRTDDAEQADVLNRLDGLTHKVVHVIGVAVDFADLLIYFEKNGIPYPIAKESIWTNILDDNLKLTDSGGVISVKEPAELELD